jgi:hypothetical protein
LVDVDGDGKKKKAPEVVDKATWNAMLDMLQFRDRVVLMMTTNATFAELDELDARECSGSLLRTGRVTQRIEMRHRNDARKDDADSRADAGRSKNNRRRKRAAAQK